MEIGPSLVHSSSKGEEQTHVFRLQVISIALLEMDPSLEQMHNFACGTKDGFTARLCGNPIFLLVKKHEEAPWDPGNLCQNPVSG